MSNLPFPSAVTPVIQPYSFVLVFEIGFHVAQAAGLELTVAEDDLSFVMLQSLSPSARITDRCHHTKRLGEHLVPRQ